MKDIVDTTIALLSSPLGAALYSADPATAVARCRELAVIALDMGGPAEDGRGPALAALMEGWARLSAIAAGAPLAASEVLAQVFPAPNSPQDDGWENLREAIRTLTGEAQPSAWRLGMVLRGLRGRYVAGRCLTAGVGRSRRVVWKVEGRPGA